ncbi:polyketide synthase dehydratase domain-containing protein, partial [Parafrankia sp. EUN1f]|uniref:polyketide synthase dehydratase domain-containing protein n=1 Tax=Parafrankia sp. EUN1f TaxID=102897 RepID=UPI0001C474F8
AAPAAGPRPVTAGAPATDGHPVLAELGAAIADTSAALSTVTDRWAGSQRPTPATPTGLSTPAASAASAAPAAASAPVAVGPDGRHTVRRELSLATMPEVIDHCFYRQPPGWPDPSDLFPVVPLTGVLEMIIAEAAALRPGRVVVEVKDVRATRWLAIEPPVQVTITCTPLTLDEIRVDVVGYTRATVVFAANHPAPPATTDVSTGFAPCAGAAGEVVIPGEASSPHSGRAIYDDRLLFHGPGYQGIESVDGMAPTGLRGRLRVTHASGALLDNAGQFFGYWGMQYLPSDWLLFPASVASIRFFGPQPGTGAGLSYLGRIREVTDRSATADMELRHTDGRLWAHVRGWTDRRFTEDDVLWSMAMAPEANTQGQSTADGWLVVTEHWRDPASRELSLRHYLDAAEREQLARHNPLAARSWLLGRIAVKDAVRRHWWERGAGEVWPIEVGVSNQPSGQPVVAAVPARPGLPTLHRPAVSAAHRPEIAVAIVADGAPERGSGVDVGVDVGVGRSATAGAGLGIGLGRVERRDRAAEAVVLAEQELHLLDELAGDDPDTRAVWFARFAAAKEAAAKATTADADAGAAASDVAASDVAASGAAVKPDGSGPAGDPRRFVVGRPVQGGRPVAAEVTHGPGGVVVRPVGEPGERPGLPAPLRIPVLAATPARISGGRGGDDGPRWVALRTMDTTGRPRTDLEPADRLVAQAGGYLGNYVVAWTSPQLQRTEQTEQIQQAEQVEQLERAGQS